MVDAAPQDVTFRIATAADLPRIVAMLADDFLGRERESMDADAEAAYRRAFEAIDADPNNELLVAEIDGRVIGMLQLTYLPSLTYQGRWRAMVEGVRVAREARSGGIGRQLLEHALERARRRDCHMVQLTTDKARPEALKFYEVLGFVASHEGMKLALE